MATIDLIVLGMLKKESMSAYDIQKLVEYRNISKWVKISTPSIYKKTIQLEGLTALKMAKTQLYPAVCDYLAKLSSEIVSIKNADLDAEFLFKDANKLTKQVKLMKEEMDKLEQNIKFAQNLDDNIEKQAIVWRDYVFTSMQSLREITDMIEESVDAKYWPIPTYVDLLFGI